MNSAVSGLGVAQSSIATLSDNIANINTKGYVRKEVVQNTITLAGQSSGVEIADIRRVTDEFLNREFRIATSEFGRFEAAGDLHQQLTTLLGDPTGDNNLVAMLDNVLVEIGQLAANPETTSVRSSVLETFKRLTEEVDHVAEGVRDLRRQADLRVGQNISDANQLLADIHELNKSINAIPGEGASVNLEGQRAQKLDELAQIIDVQGVTQENGRLLVSTTGGLPLIDGNLRQLTHTPDGSGAFGVVYQPIGIERINDVNGSTTQVSTNIDSAILSGELRGLLDTRDGALNDMAIELGAYAGHVADQINSVHNAFTAVPPPATMTGHNSGALASDPHGFSGIAAFHTFDANNNVTATATIDFGAIGGTVNDVINAVNTGLGGAGTLSLTNGIMSFSAAGASIGVAIAQDATTPSNADGRGFAHRFGMNDLVRTTNGPHFQTGLQAGSAHGFTGTVIFEMVGPQNQRPQTSTIDMGAIGGTVGDLVNQLNTDFTGVASFSLSAAGEIVASPSTAFAVFDFEATSDQTTRGGTGKSVSDLFGIGSASLAAVAPGIALRPDIPLNSALLSLASVNASGTPAVFSGDNAGANALQGLSFATSDFAGAGRMGAITGTLGELGGELLGRAGQAASEIEFRGRDREALRDELSLRVGEVSGVNIDEEMAKLIQLQAAFNAATRVISATNEMIDALLRI
jgi:flagellar hook-associated protein 1 FlgK